jgi:hypothetical protein
MSSTRQLHLGAFMRPASIHTGAWRYPGAYADANFNIAHLRRFAQTLEAAKFDAFFMADHMALLNMPIDALKRSHTATSFEPFTLLLSAGGARRLRQPRRSRTAAARAVSARIRRQDSARESRVAPPKEPLLFILSGHREKIAAVSALLTCQILY